jgi:hypothetical protein
MNHRTTSGNLSFDEIPNAQATVPDEQRGSLASLSLSFNLLMSGLSSRGGVSL